MQDISINELRFIYGAAQNCSKSSSITLKEFEACQMVGISDSLATCSFADPKMSSWSMNFCNGIPSPAIPPQSSAAAYIACGPETTMIVFNGAGWGGDMTISCYYIPLKP